MSTNVHATPQRKPPTPFTKMHGSGNDVALFFVRDDQPLPGRERLRALSDRRTGIGFDQLIWITPARDDGVVVHYRIFNADGSEVEQCGNGARCVAQAWHERNAGADTFVLSSPAGPIAAHVDATGVTLDMGAPRRPAPGLPAAANDERPMAGIDALGQTWPLWLVSMGNPHAVLITDAVSTAPVEDLGRALQHHPVFPDGVNVGFLEPRSRTAGQLRVFERGVGETAACGSGACAAHVAGVHAGAFDTETALSLPGGDLVVSWRGHGEPVWLRGPAETVYQGTIDL